MTKPTKWVCTQRRLWSDWVDQPGHPPSLIRVFAVCMKKAWVLSYPLSAQHRLWSDWVDAQADLSLRWVHSHFIGFFMTWLISSDTHLLCFSGSVWATSQENLSLGVFRGARWLSGRVSDSGARGPGFETYRRRVVSLSKTLYSPKVLVNYPGSDGSVPIWLKNCWLGR